MTNFISNVLKLISGTIIAQIIGIVLIPIITRLYSPSDYGIFQLFLSTSSILAIISCYSYQLSIMLPKEDEDSVNIVSLCIILVILNSFFFGIIIFFFSDWISELLHAPMLSQYLFLMPFVVLFNGIMIVMNYWLSRKEQFGIIAISQLTNSSSCRVLQIVYCICFSSSPFGLIFGIFVGYFLGSVVMIKGFFSAIPSFKGISIRKIREMAVTYKKFPLFSSWSAVSNSISIQIAPFMLAVYFSPTVVGLFGMAHIAVNMPMNLVGTAIGQVFFQKVSYEKNTTGIVKYVVKEIHQRLITIGLFPILVLMIIGEDLFSFVLGVQWSTAGEYARILAPWILLVFIASPLTHIFSIMELQKKGLIFNLIILLSRLIVLIIGGIYGDPIITLFLFSITGVFFWGWMNLYILKISGISYHESLSYFTIELLIGFFVALPILISVFYSDSKIITFIIAVIMTFIYYYIAIIRNPFNIEEYC